MARFLFIALAATCGLAIGQEVPSPPAASRGVTKTGAVTAQSPVRVIESGSGAVGVNPKQPYRPIPLNQTQPRETIFEFYLKALNPRQIKWGDEIDQRLAVLAAQSIRNPYFRLCALETAAILVLVLVCWIWWDKMRQIKWAAAECLTDAINAKKLADHGALEAIGHYNRHIEMCNRVIERQESGLATGGGSEEWQRQIRDLQTQLASERGNSARLTTELKNRDELQSQMEARIRQLEETMLGRQNGANAELVARLQRAEAELGSRKTARR